MASALLMRAGSDWRSKCVLMNTNSLVGGTVDHAGPRDDAGHVVAPRLGGDEVGGVGEPELVPFEHGDALGVVEDRGVLAVAATVAAVADHLVRRQGCLDGCELVVQPLLDAEDGGLLELEELGEDRRAVGPVVGLAGLGLTRVVADVERHDVELSAHGLADERLAARRSVGRGDGCSGGDAEGAEACESGATGDCRGVHLNSSL